MSYNTVVWLPNAMVVTALLAAFAWWRWRSGGPLAGIRWVGVAMLPLALYAIGLYRLTWTVGIAFEHFFTGLVWRPRVWFGVLMLAVAVGLIFLPRWLRPSTDSGATDRGRPRITARRSTPAGDDDMAEIEDILKKHGIG